MEKDVGKQHTRPTLPTHQNAFLSHSTPLSNIDALRLTVTATLSLTKNVVESIGTVRRKATAEEITPHGARKKKNMPAQQHATRSFNLRGQTVSLAFHSHRELHRRLFYLPGSQSALTIL